MSVPSSLPYHGLRIIDLSAVVSGPMATGIFADQGADVIKVETAQGDLTRIIGPAKGELASGLTGEGRMEEPDVIVKNLEAYFSSNSVLKFICFSANCLASFAWCLDQSLG